MAILLGDRPHFGTAAKLNPEIKSSEDTFIKNEVPSLLQRLRGEAHDDDPAAYGMGGVAIAPR